MKLCSYVVRHDGGFSPNPFGGFCTLAACTPNHQGARLKAGDWLMGNSTKQDGQRLVYAMRISEVLPFEEYYADPRFQAKKPRLRGLRSEQCGDNIYHRGPDGAWIQGPNPSHDEQRIAQDTKNPRVFISDHFYYFGSAAPAIPEEFGSLIRERQGIKYTRETALIEAFARWLESRFPPGRLADPAAWGAGDGCGDTKKPPRKPVRKGRTPSGGTC